MHQRIIFAASALLFLLVASVVNIMTDVHDRNFPETLGATSSLYLDFTRAGVSDTEAFDELGRLSDRDGLGLVKVQPDLSGDQEGQVFVELGTKQTSPAKVDWYGSQPVTAVRDSSVLQHSFATGQYLATGDRVGLDRAERDLVAQGVKVKRADDTVGQTWVFVLKQGSFRTTLLAGVALMAALALYWMSIRARGRALRVLGGVPARRIQLQDLGAFTIPILTAAAVVSVGAFAWVGVTHGGPYLPYFAQTLLSLTGALVLSALTFALVIAVASWPGADVLTNRQPAVRSLRRATTALKAICFVLVVATAGPAWLAYRDASATAAQQAQWKPLSDQVALRYPAALGEAGFQQLIHRVGGVVQQAQARDAEAMSYTMTPEQLGNGDFASYGSLALVDASWLNLMGHGAADGRLVPVGVDRVPASIRDDLEANLRIWSRSGVTGSRVHKSFDFYRTRDGVEIPLAEGGSGELVFPDDALIAVVPDLHATFNDDFLASLSSSNNIVFAGLDPTLRLLADQGLQHTVSVKYVAEDGILRAQLSAYQAWLRALSLLSLLAALAMATGISAFIAALLAVRRDFPMRLNGTRWVVILRGRVTHEWLAGGALAAAVLAFQQTSTIPVVLVVALVALVVAPLSHLAAARWCFATMSHRRI